MGLGAGGLVFALALPALAHQEPDQDWVHVPRLIHEARRGDWNTRVRAVHALGRIGSIEGLDEGLMDGDWQIRLTAVHWLGRQGEAGVSSLARALGGEPCRIVRLAAIHWLGASGPKAIPALKEATEQESPGVRLAIAYWLRKLEVGPDPAQDFEPPSVDDPGLLHRATTENLRGCDSVNLPPRRVEPIPEPEPEPPGLAGEPDGSVEEAPEPAPDRSPKASKQRAAAALPSSQALRQKAERTEALALLPEPPAIGGGSESAPPPAPAPSLPRTAEEQAAALAPAPVREPFLPPAPPIGLPLSEPAKLPEAPPPEALPRDQPKPQLSRPLAGEAQKLPPVPTWHLVRREDDTMDLALNAPEESPRPRHDPLPELLKTLRSSNWRHRYRAADLLGVMGPAAAPAVPALIDALKDKRSQVRSSAALALGNIGSASGPAVPLLTRALKDSRADVRYSAALALGRIGTAEANRAFQRHLRSEAERMITEGAR